MTDRPILFSASMVRAILDGRKVQTRRVLKVLNSSMLAAAERDGGRCLLQFSRFAKGDRLWVREAWTFINMMEDPAPLVCIGYDADGEGLPDRPIIKVRPEVITKLWDGRDPWKHRKRRAFHMFREFSRLTLTVTDVRVQRLQEISEADCIAEGPPALTEMRGLGQPLDGVMVWDPAEPHIRKTPRCWYRELWDKINGRGGWNANPWVVVVTFTSERKNIDG